MIKKIFKNLDGVFIAIVLLGSNIVTLAFTYATGNEIISLLIGGIFGLCVIFYRIKDKKSEGKNEF